MCILLFCLRFSFRTSVCFDYLSSLACIPCSEYLFALALGIFPISYLGFFITLCSGVLDGWFTLLLLLYWLYFSSLSPLWHIGIGPGNGSYDSNDCDER